MAPSMAIRQTCCCFNVRIATTALAIYHVRFPGSRGRHRSRSPGLCLRKQVTISTVLVKGGHQKLLYQLNEGPYGIFRICLREIAPRMPIVVGSCELGSKPPLFPCIPYGPTCDAFDKLFEKEVQLPELDVGTWLIFPSMGTYSWVMSSIFNSFLSTSISYAMGPEFRCLGGMTKMLSPGSDWHRDLVAEL
ncbi:ornithine decarboxylase-like [Pteronotus mesoamericanus]|uniref:ornithine decarboxylase-like n=1 Tax=Pteronotus mesoamericanus TaxID=1884717 RepID=UPI0023EE01CF|nr:ornithine decarboxylase-like [Pteronotus parnellii mesoamericanus]